MPNDGQPEQDAADELHAMAHDLCHHLALSLSEFLDEVDPDDNGVESGCIMLGIEMFREFVKQRFTAHGVNGEVFRIARRQGRECGRAFYADAMEQIAAGVTAEAIAAAQKPEPT